jgi:BCD family chlorophyll transporter-like MFS transporter
MNTNVSSMELDLDRMEQQTLTWLGIIRLGFIQTCIGAIVVMTSSQRSIGIMVVEYALPAALPGFLVALHYFVQLIRPRMGFASDQGKNKTPWIIGGMGVLALGGIGASIGTVLFANNTVLGLLVSILAFVLIGVGVSTSGTSLLALLAKSVNDQRRAAAATLVWIMMIFGFAFTSVTIGKFLDPFSPEKVIWIAVIISGIAFLITNVALYKLESGLVVTSELKKPAEPMDFKQVIAEVRADPDIRHFTKFILFPCWHLVHRI